MISEVQIVHQVQGRLRLKIAMIREDSNGVEALTSSLFCLTGVISIRVNDLARSLIIDYNPSQLTGEVIFKQTEQFLQEFAVDHSLLYTPTGEGESSNPSFTPDPLDVEFLQRLALPTIGLGSALLATVAGLPISPVILGAITLVAALPLLKRTRQDLAQGKFDEEILESIWTIFYGLTGDFVAPNLDLILGEVADLLQESTCQTPMPSQPSTILNCEQVRVIQQGQPQDIPFTDLHQGDRVLLQPGDLCPADGRILEGEAWLDFSTLTGEPTPLPRGVDKRILAGCTVLDGQVLMEVEALGQETQYAQELLLAEVPPLQQTQVSNSAKAMGQSLIVPTLALSGTLFLLTNNLERALAPLQLDLITGIRLSAPTAILSMLKYAQQQNIEVSSGRVFETLKQADTVIFARTGTLTERELSVAIIEMLNQEDLPLNGENLEPTHWLMTMAAAAEQCEQQWQHPVARAIVSYAQQLGLTIPPSQVCYPKTGYSLGVSAQVNHQQVIVGSRNYLKQAGIVFPDDLDNQPGIQDGQYRGYWYVYVAVDHQLVGQITCCATVRFESRAVVMGLQERGLRVYMVTGSSPEVARAIAEQVGIEPERVFAELSPQDKKAFVCRLQREGHTVVYMGEGMDDYPALCYANIAVGTHQSCTAVQEIADLRLPYGDLTALLKAFEMADQAIAIVQQNIALISLPHLGATTLGVFLILDPVLVVIINNTANLLAILNALRPFWWSTLTQDQLKM